MHKNKIYLCAKYILYIPSIYDIIIYRKGRKAPNRKENVKMEKMIEMIKAAYIKVYGVEKWNSMTAQEQHGAIMFIANDALNQIS